MSVPHSANLVSHLPFHSRFLSPQGAVDSEPSSVTTFSGSGVFSSSLLDTTLASCHITFPSASCTWVSGVKSEKPRVKLPKRTCYVLYLLAQKRQSDHFEARILIKEQRNIQDVILPLRTFNNFNSVANPFAYICT